MSPGKYAIGLGTTLATFIGLWGVFLYAVVHVPVVFLCLFLAIASVGSLIGGTLGYRRWIAIHYPEASAHRPGQSTTEQLRSVLATSFLAGIAIAAVSPLLVSIYLRIYSAVMPLFLIALAVGPWATLKAWKRMKS